MALTIVSHEFLSPTGGSYAYDVNVPIDYKIKLTFSENLNISSINSSTIALVEIASDSILTGPDVVSVWDKNIGEGGAFKTNALPNRISTTFEVADAVLTITPSSPLNPEKTYQLVLTSGITSEVDYTATFVTVTGSGQTPVVEGSHTHSSSHVLLVTIGTTGTAGTATFNWTSGSGSYYRNGVVTSLYFQELSNWDTDPSTGEPGIFVKFGTGTYNAGDNWTFGLSSSVSALAATNIVQFTTLAQSTLINVPGAQAPLIEPPVAGQRIVGSYAAATPSLTVSTLSVEADSYNITAPTSLVLTFNKPLKVSTVTTSTVKVYGNAVFGSTSVPSPEGAVISTAVTPSGSTVTITINTTEVGNNNELKLYLSSSISSEGVTPTELTLRTDQYYYFYTQFDPFYTTVEELRLEYGGLLSAIDDLTLAKLIYQYSSFVDIYNTVALSGVSFAQIAQSYVHCAVINTLIKGGYLDLPGGNSKSLGDLKFSNQISNSSLSNVLLKDTEKCMLDMMTLLTGASNMTTVVRADNHPDTPLIGRLWVNVEGYPGAPSNYLLRGSRRIKKGW